MNQPPHQKPCLIRLQDGTEYIATLQHLNPRYHTYVKELDRWRRVDEVPKKQRWIDCDKVVYWEVLPDNSINKKELK